MARPRLRKKSPCASYSRQKTVVPLDESNFIDSEREIVFSGREHDGNIPQRDEEVQRVKPIYQERLVYCT